MRNVECGTAAGGALELAGLVFVHFVADEEFAEFRVDVAIQGDKPSYATRRAGR
jgi:hypothetical protein